MRKDEPQGKRPLNNTSSAGAIPARLIFKQGLHKGLHGALWMYKILIPISFLTFVLEISHLLDRAEGLLGPLMGIIHLPAKAAMPLIAGVLTGIYGGIAAMSVLAFSLRETTLIAIFLLISHGLVQESAIQGKAGMHPLRATLIRLSTSIVVVWLVGFFWKDSGATDAPTTIPAALQPDFWLAFQAWCLQTLVLSLKILAIIIVIMTVIAWMKATRATERIAAILRPVLRLMGLSERVNLLWLTALLFGISYGAAVIVEETRENQLAQSDLEGLHVSIGINHAMIEDPALFLPLGVHPVWLWLPRLAAAFAAAHALRLFRGLQKARAKAGVVSSRS